MTTFFCGSGNGPKWSGKAGPRAGKIPEKNRKNPGPGCVTRVPWPPSLSPLRHFTQESIKKRQPERFRWLEKGQTPHDLIRIAQEAREAQEAQQRDEERTPTTTGNPTEQPQPDTEDIPALDKPDQELAYAIVNTFLDNPTLQSSDAEKSIKRVIVQAKQWRPAVLQNIDEVLRPVFFHYTNGNKDKTRWTSRDPAPYIKAWRDTAEWRDLLVEPGANSKGLQFSREQVAPIVHHITQEFINKHATDEQRQDSFQKNKSRAEARLNRLCGSRHVANAIWQLGLPKVISPATEQRYAPHELEIATANVLQWLAKLAELIQAHKATPDYEDNRRKSGDRWGRSGLTPAELEAKSSKKIGKAVTQKWAKKW